MQILPTNIDREQKYADDDQINMSASPDRSGPAGFLVIGFAMASTYQCLPLLAQVAAGGAVAALGPKPRDAQVRQQHHQPA